MNHYNLRTRDKHFTVGETVLVLLPDSNSSRVFNKWKGPAKVVEILSPYSYLIEMDDGRRQHLHANRLRKYNVKVDEVECTSVGIEVDCSCAVIYDRDVEFGRVETVDVSEVDESVGLPYVDDLPSQKIDSNRVSHLTPRQRQELFDILDKYSECFSEKPGPTAAIPTATIFRGCLSKSGLSNHE